MAWAALGDAPRSTIYPYAIWLNRVNIASDPFGLAVAQLLHNVRVDHGRVREEALFGWRRNVLEVAVEQLSQEKLGNKGKEGLLAEYVEGQESVYDDIAWNDPFV